MYREHSETDRDLLIAAFGGKLFALERATGRVRWEVILTPPCNVVDLHIGRTIVLAVTGRHLTFVDYATGAVRRVVEQAGEHLTNRPSVLIDGAQIFIGSNGEVCCYTQDGDLVWVQPFAGKGFGGVALGFPDNVRQVDHGRS
jgi:outer membrane protein assembly factor BamB